MAWRIIHDNDMHVHSRTLTHTHALKRGGERKKEVWRRKGREGGREGEEREIAHARLIPHPLLLLGRRVQLCRLLAVPRRNLRRLERCGP